MGSEMCIRDSAKTAQNFNPDAARCADITIVQAEELVEAIPPAEVDVPGIYVDRVVEVGKQETGIEFRTVSK